MANTLRSFPLQNAVCFIIITYLVPVLFTFYIQCVLKLKKKLFRPQKFIQTKEKCGCYYGRITHGGCGEHATLRSVSAPIFQTPRKGHDMAGSGPNLLTHALYKLYIKSKGQDHPRKATKAHRGSI